MHAEVQTRSENPDGAFRLGDVPSKQTGIEAINALYGN
jgi:hypothetical protein